MGKLVFNETQEYIEEIIDTRLHDDYSSYSRFLGSAPIFVTYYKQNVVETTTDKGLGNVNHNYKDSGKKYIKINSFPLWDIDKSSLELNMENGIIKADYKTEATAVPNIITPIVDDYITLHYMDDEMTFKITDVQIDNIKSDNYYKLSIKYSTIKRFYLDKLVTETFECIFDKIGTEDKCLIKDIHLENIKKLTNIYNEISSLYIDEFYDNTSNSLLLREDNRMILYDPYLTKFVADNKLFEKKKSTSGINIIEIVKPINNFTKKYIKSIYNSFIKEKQIRIYNPKYRAVRIIDLDSYFGNTARNYCQIDLSENNPENDFLFTKDYIRFIDKKPRIDFPVVDMVNTKYGDNCEFLPLDEPLDKFIQFCRIFNSKEEDYYERLITFAFDNFDDMYMEHNMDYYVFTVLVLYILQYLINHKAKEN